MLKKKLCKACANASQRPCWTWRDEENWDKRGFVWCPWCQRRDREIWTKIDDENMPPPECPYALEQFMENQ